MWIRIQDSGVICTGINLYHAVRIVSWVAMSNCVWTNLPCELPGAELWPIITINKQPGEMSEIRVDIIQFAADHHGHVIAAGLNNKLRQRPSSCWTKEKCERWTSKKSWSDLACHLDHTCFFSHTMPSNAHHLQLFAAVVWTFSFTYHADW